MVNTKLLNYPDVIAHTRQYVDGIPIQIIETDSRALENYLQLIPKKSQLLQPIQAYLNSIAPCDLATEYTSFGPYDNKLSYSEVKKYLFETLQPLDIIYARKFNALSPFRLDNVSDVSYDALGPTPYNTTLPWTKKADTIPHIFDVLPASLNHYGFAMAPVYKQPDKKIFLFHSTINLTTKYSSNACFCEQGLAIVLKRPKIPLSIIASILFHMDRGLADYLQWQLDVYTINRIECGKTAGEFEKAGGVPQNIII